MKYFIDTEFIEGPQKERFPISLFRKHTKPTIDLISIGIVAEDGREYYAVSKDFNLHEAWNRFQIEEQSGDMRNIFPEGKKVYWLREYVLKPIYYELINKDINFHQYDKFFTYDSLRNLINKKGKTNKQIAEDIIEFCDPTPIEERIFTNPEFYAYYADYDWVVFCWIFGKMMDLPQGFPMYCKDLKQEFDFYNGNFIKRKALNAVGNLHKSINELKDFKDYPKQENEHNALDDARWNKKLYEFLNKL